MPSPTPELPEDLRRIFEKLDSIRGYAAELERRLKMATYALERIRDTRSIIGNPLEIRRIIEEALALFPVDKKKEDGE